MIAVERHPKTAKIIIERTGQIYIVTVRVIRDLGSIVEEICQQRRFRTPSDALMWGRTFSKEEGVGSIQLVNLSHEWIEEWPAPQWIADG